MKRLFFVGFWTIYALVNQVYSQDFKTWAKTPPMGWNSWNCYGTTVTESEVKANAEYMATNLKKYGWEYVIIDARWYVSNTQAGTYTTVGAVQYNYDQYGRYTPAVNKFPSAANGAGFKPLADYIHSLGLKFGLHMMRGVPIIAVTNALPIKDGNGATAASISSQNVLCTWLLDNYTVESSRVGSQAWYDSVFELLASWGVDFVKIDDLSRPYHTSEIEMIRKAIDKSGRPIVLSLSPGETPITQASHVSSQANQWRMTDDFWDNWSQLRYQFGISEKWYPYIQEGTYPDADMLQLGRISIRGERGVDRQTNFTSDEQYTHMSLWSIIKSPLFFGGDFPSLTQTTTADLIAKNEFTKNLITNEEVLDMHKYSTANAPLFNQDSHIAWWAKDESTGEKYLGLFNVSGSEYVNYSKALYRSGAITRLTNGYSTDVTANLSTSAKYIYLAVTDNDDGYTCDHADWISPRVYNDAGDCIFLTSLTWEQATSGWSSVQINKGVSGNTLDINGTDYTNGLGTHANSLIQYALPTGYHIFKATAGIDIGGTSQTIGGASMEFLVFEEDPTMRSVDVNKALVNTGKISPKYQTQGVQLDVDITGATKLYLVVTDAGDGIDYDHANWGNAAIYKADNTVTYLSDLNWVSATNGWNGDPKKDKNNDSGTMLINGVTYTKGLGVNSYSIIEYDVPAGYTRFKSYVGIDDGVKSQTSGATVEFLVYTQSPAKNTIESIPVDLAALSITGDCVIRNMWTKTDLGTFSGKNFAPMIAQHGAGLYKLSPTNRTNNLNVTLQTSKMTIEKGSIVTFNIDVTQTTGTSKPTGSIILYNNDTRVAIGSIDTNGKISFSTDSLALGTHQIYALYRGNEVYLSKTSSTITVTVINDIIPPTITLSVTDATNSSATFLLASNENGRIYYVINDDATFAITTANSIELSVTENTSISIPSTDLIEGKTYYVYALAFDNAGNSASKQISFTPHSGTSVTDCKIINEVKATPNPASDKVTISYKLLETSEINIELLTVSGQKLEVIENATKKAGQNQVTFDVKGLQTGTYIYKVNTSKGSVSKLLMIQH